LKNKKASLLLSDPRLMHLGRAVELDAGFLLWFEPREKEAAKQQLRDTLVQKNGDQTTGKQQLLLWARAPSASERELMSGLKWVEIDLIESPDPEVGFASRVKENFRLLADGIERAAEAEQVVK